MIDEKPTCPFCESNKIRDFVYGLIRFKSDEDMKKFREAHIVAGCLTAEDSPAFHCDDCNKNFGNYDEVRKRKANRPE